MTPTERGRFCAMCTKEVVDFTGMSDAEINQHLEQAKDNVCGRFVKNQLNRNLVLSPNQVVEPQFVYFHKWIAASLMLGAFNFLRAQNIEPQVTQVEQTIPENPPSDSQKIEKTTKNSVTISGIIWDSLDQEPVAFAQVFVKDLKGCVSDLNGNFKLVLENILPTDTLVLDVRCFGYEPYTLVIDLSNCSDTMEVVLEPMRIDFLQDQRRLVGEYMVGGPMYTSRWQRFWWRMKFWKRWGNR